MVLSVVFNSFAASKVVKVADIVRTLNGHCGQCYGHLRTFKNISNETKTAAKFYCSIFLGSGSYLCGYWGGGSPGAVVVLTFAMVSCETLATFAISLIVTIGFCSSDF
jgi:hypothetical protein